MVAKISFALAYNVMLMSRLSSLLHISCYAYAYVVVGTRLNCFAILFQQHSSYVCSDIYCTLGFATYPHCGCRCYQSARWIIFKV